MIGKFLLFFDYNYLNTDISLCIYQRAVQRQHTDFYKCLHQTFIEQSQIPRPLLFSC